MKTRILLSAAALVAGYTLAAAQTAPPASAPPAGNDSIAAEPAPSAIRNAPPDKIEPANELKARAEPKLDKPSETTGEAVRQNVTQPLTPGDNKVPSNDTPSPDFPRKQ